MAAEKKTQSAPAPAGATSTSAEGAAGSLEQTPPAPPPAPSDGQPPAGPELTQDEAAKLAQPAGEPVYVVAPGVSLCGTKAGMIESGQPVTPDHFPHPKREDREDWFAELVKRGTIVAK